MQHPLASVPRQSLADDLARRIRQLIRQRQQKAGDRLPSIAEMARLFGVGPPTLREALKKLDTAGVVAIRHGWGVYAAEHHDTLVIPNPVHDVAASKKLLLDLIEARIPIEVRSASLAAEHATPGTSPSSPPSSTRRAPTSTTARCSTGPTSPSTARSPSPPATRCSSSSSRSWRVSSARSSG